MTIGATQGVLHKWLVANHGEHRHDLYTALVLSLRRLFPCGEQHTGAGEAAASPKPAAQPAPGRCLMLIGQRWQSTDCPEHRSGRDGEQSP
jgi:hypothetical protein